MLVWAVAVAERTALGGLGCAASILEQLIFQFIIDKLVGMGLGWREEG